MNLDPANLVMMVGDDPVRAVYTLKDYIVHTHAKDGRQLRAAGAGGDAAFEELPLGKGDVDFPRYLQALADIGFRGFLTVEREVGDAPERDIQDALAFLRRSMGA